MAIVKIILLAVAILSATSQNSFAQRTKKQDAKDATYARNLNIAVPEPAAKILKEIVAEYSKQNNVSTLLIIDSSDSLINRIQMGERADIFISMHPSYIDILYQHGLLSVNSGVSFMQDNLVLASLNNKHPKLNSVDLSELKISDTLWLPNVKTSEVGLHLQDFTKLHLKLNKKYKNILSAEKRQEAFKEETLNMFASKHGAQFVNGPFPKIIQNLQRSNPSYTICFGSQAVDYNLNIVSIINTNSVIGYHALGIASTNMTEASLFLEFLQDDDVVKKIVDKYKTKTHSNGGAAAN